MLEKQKAELKEKHPAYSPSDEDLARLKQEAVQVAEKFKSK